MPPRFCRKIPWLTANLLHGFVCFIGHCCLINEVYSRRYPKERISLKLTYSSWLTVLILAFVAARATAQENASNPLAAVNNTDLRFQYFDLGGESDRTDLWMDAAYMLTPKLNYELHYWNTYVTGSRESGFETLHLKPTQSPS